MKMNDVFPSKWIRAEDLGDEEVQLKIQSVSMEELQSPDGKKEHKAVARFVGQEKGLILSKTNWERIAKQHGDDSDLWIGKFITLYAEPEARSESGYAARVKVPKPKPTGGLVKPAAPVAAAVDGGSDIPS